MESSARVNAVEGDYLREEGTGNETMGKVYMAVRLGCLECFDGIPNHIELFPLQPGWSPTTQAYWVDNPRSLSGLWLDAHLRSSQ